jgi:L-lactate dehydrogenase complex protein LldG
MSVARDAILAGIRRALGRGPLSLERAAELRSELTAHRRNLLPARATTLDHPAQVDLFVSMAEEVQATVTRVASPDEIPDAVTRYLATENLAAELVPAPDSRLDNIPWHTRPLLNIRRGRAEATDPASLTACFAAIAESGTLMLVSGAETPTSLNFLPDTHIVLVESGQVVATYEDGWDRLRAAADRGDGRTGGLPRVANFITGPSRTADIEQRIVLGAHGPRRLHIVLVESHADTELGHDE